MATSSAPAGSASRSGQIPRGLLGLVVSGGALAVLVLLTIVHAVKPFSDSVICWASVALVLLALVPALAFGRSWLRSLPLGVIALSALGSAAAAVIDALDQSTSGHYLAAGVAAFLAVAVGTVDTAGRSVAGVRAWPRWWAVAALIVWAGASLAWLVVDGATSATYDAIVAVGVVAAPTALALAVLGSVAFGALLGDREGVRLRDTAAVPDLASVRGLILDGLGTVVDGKHVAEVQPIEESHLRNLRWFAGALAHAGEDPVSHAIARLSVRGNLTAVTQSGSGLTGNVDRHPVRLAPPEAMGLLAADVAVVPGDTIGVEVDLRPLGTIRVEDSVRAGAGEAIVALRELDLDPVLVTSASAPTAAAVMTEAGLTRLVSRPHADHPDFTEALRLAGTPAAVVGARETIPGAAIVLGPSGTTVALDVASVQRAATAVRLGRGIAAAVRRATLVALVGQVALVLAAVSGVFSAQVSAIGALVLASVVTALAWPRWGGSLASAATVPSPSGVASAPTSAPSSASA